MKEHIQSQMVNELRDIAIKYHSCQCLREVIVRCVDKYLKLDKEYK